MSSRKVLLTAVALGALATAGIAYSSAGPAARKLNLTSAHVYGGGQLGPGTFSNGSFTISHPRDISVDAHKVGPLVTGHLYYGVNETGRLILGGDVKCLVVKGNTAAIGGVIRESSDPYVPYGFVIFLRDNGPSLSPTRDQSSAAFIDPLSSSNWPAGFPYVCPAPDGPFNTVGYLDVHSGDVVVDGG